MVTSPPVKNIVDKMPGKGKQQNTPNKKSSRPRTPKKSGGGPATPPAKKQAQFATPPSKKENTPHGKRGGGAKKQQQANNAHTPLRHSFSAPRSHLATPPPSEQNRYAATPSPKTLSAAYAGSKCYEPPTPESLPKPPSSWTGSDSNAMLESPFQKLVSSMQKRSEQEEDSRDSGNDPVSLHLKTLLKVHG